MVRYLKIVIQTVPCSACKGEGFRWETVYHNQEKKCKCYICGGSGQCQVESQTDITDKINKLYQIIKK